MGGGGLRQKLAEFMVSEDEEEELTWDNTYAKITETAKEVLSKSKPETYLKKESRWWNEEVQEAVKKKTAFKKWHRTRTKEDRDEYRTLDKSAKAEVAKTKEEEYKKLYTEVKRNVPR